MRSLRLVLDLLLKPCLVSRLVLLPHLPLAGVVGERGLVDHGDAVRHGAHRLADPTTTARFHIRVVVRVGRDVEAGVRALQPAQRALHAGVEIHDRPHRAGGILLEGGVAVGAESAGLLCGRVSHRLARGDAGNGQPLAQLIPLRELKLVGFLGVALRRRDHAGRDPLVRLLRRFHLQLIVPFFSDGLLDRCQAEQIGQHLCDRPQQTDIRMVILVDPQPREAGDAGQERQPVREFLPMAHRYDRVGAVHRRHDQRAAGLQEAVDRLEPVPGPRLHPLAQGVVDGDGNIHFLGLVLRHPFLQRLVVRGDDGEIFCGNPVALGAVAVTAKRNPDLAVVFGGQRNSAAYILGQVFLKDPAVDDLHCKEAAHWLSSHP